MRPRTIVFSSRLSGAPLAFFLICLLAAFMPKAMANPVAIQDASFDERGLNSGSLSTTLTPWLETGGTANGNGWIERVSGFAADGRNHLAMNLNHNVWQDLGVTYQANTRYTLTVAVGRRSSTLTSSANQSRYLLAASDGTIFATGTLNASTLPLSTFVDAPALVFETGDRSAATGKTIRILLQAGGSGRSHFDKIRLTAVSTLPPVATTLAATEVTDISAILNGTVNARGAVTNVVFEYGPTTDYGTTISAAPFSIFGSTGTAVVATPSGLTPGTTYHYRVVATNEAGTVFGAALTFTTETPAYLSSLAVSESRISPAFAETVSSYFVQVPPGTPSIRLTPETVEPGATIRVQGIEVTSGTASDAIPLADGNTAITVGVTAAGASFSKNYQVTVIRPPATFVFTSADKPAFSAHSFNATGLSADLSLGFAPSPGTTLTVVENSGLAWIKGRFGNLAHGGVVELVHDGIRYAMVADYHGGDGNDLVLKWAHQRLFGWGVNNAGQVGDGTTIFRIMPVPVDTSGGLAGKVVLNVFSAHGKTFALCADGSIFQWVLDKPVEHQKTGALEGRRVVSIAIGSDHQLALCDDGTLAVWGVNANGVFGPAVPSWSSGGQTPLEVPMVGVLDGKTIVAIACGAHHNLILCDDGSLIAWGNNERGQLGNGTTAWTVSEPVLVDRSGVLADKKVVSISAGSNLSMALCDDGTVAAWGTNGDGQLGIGVSSVGRSEVPVLIDHAPFAGKPVVAISSGWSHTLALLSDGRVFAWGYNSTYELGNGTTSRAYSPVAVTAGPGDVLENRKVIAISAGNSSSLAICEDGVAVDWGSTGVWNQNIKRPRLLEMAGVGSDNPVVGGVRGSGTGILVVALPPAPLVSTGEPRAITDHAAVLAGSVTPNGGVVRCYFELGPTLNYGTIVEADPATADGVAEVDVSAFADSLKNGVTYHYRLVAEVPSGRIFGEDRTFTTTSLAALTSLATDHGALWPAFDGTETFHDLVVPNDVESIRFQFATANEAAAVSVDGAPAITGGGAAVVAIPEAGKTVIIAVDAGDGIRFLTYEVRVIRLPSVFHLNRPDLDPIVVSGFTAFGEIGIELDFVPPVGTDFMLVRNTGLAPINGAFSNLPQGTLIHLVHEGVRYPFVVNYFGGNGNDLILQWASTRLASWGENSGGQLGRGAGGNSVINRSIPGAVDSSGILAGKTVIDVATGGGSIATSTVGYVVAICNDGTIATWGTNGQGQLGDGTTTGRSLPGGMIQDGALAGKTPVAAAVGREHVLVLCSDGALVAWGNNTRGELGTGDTLRRLAPVLINDSGPLAGRRVVAIAASLRSSHALCDDGSIFSWGDNQFGQLGDGTNTDRALPTQVDPTGILNGQKVVAITSGFNHVLALCSDGRFAGWGTGHNGMLGTASTANSNVPRWADFSGVLATRPVIDLKAGASHSVALCEDGVLASWGFGESGQLGNGSGSDMLVPALVDMTGILSDKTITRLAAGAAFSLALTSDGTLASWGNNNGGTLGIGTTFGSQSRPVKVDASILRPGERFTEVFSSGSSLFSLALIAGPPAPESFTLAAEGILDSEASLNARIQPNNNDDVTVFFELWMESGLVRRIDATPATVSGSGHIDVAAIADDLLPNTEYHYRVVTENLHGTLAAGEKAFTTTAGATLSGFSLSHGIVFEEFDQKRFSYHATVAAEVTSITLSPVATTTDATITVNDHPVASGGTSQALALAPGANTARIVVTSADGASTLAYDVVVTRLIEQFVLTSATSVPFAVQALALDGGSATLDLSFAPAPGDVLTVINNTGPHPIRGAFENLVQGGTVELAHEGVIYRFLIDYHGGTGNDLVLRWATTRLTAWGNNSSGQLGNASTINSLVAVPVVPGSIEGRPILKFSAGGARGLVLCADGTLHQWGSNVAGNIASTNWQQSNVPIAVNQSGVLEGKRVVSIATGDTHSLALCSDGTMVAWGDNRQSQLGNPDVGHWGETHPVAVKQSGALAGKTIAAIAAGYNFNLVLCSDGTLVSWGSNWEGKLGHGTVGDSFSRTSEPTAVVQSGVLAVKTVVAIAAGSSHCLVLCSDGTLVTWGRNSNGQLGNGFTSASGHPVRVDQTGVLNGKTVTAIAAGYYDNMVLCSDGTIAAWGSGNFGSLGNGTSSRSLVPVAVHATGALAGKFISAVHAGDAYTLALASDGSLIGWGRNSSGELGNGTTTNSNVPVLVEPTTLADGERFMALSAGGNNTLAMVAMPPPPRPQTLAATDLADTAATLRGRVNAAGSVIHVTFEYGLTEAYGQRIAAVPPTVSGTTATDVSVRLDSLLPSTTYHYRVVVAGPAETVVGENMTFTTSGLARLSGLELVETTFTPEFDPNLLAYSATVSSETASLTLIPTAEAATTRLSVNGTAVPSGQPSAPLPLATGMNVLEVVTEAIDGVNTITYRVKVVRLPQRFRFANANDVPLALDGFFATGQAPEFELAFAPLPGTDLTLVRILGSQAIQGQFSDLGHGRVVAMDYDGITYPFVLDYFGGSGRDLVLRWGGTRLMTWGGNGNGQIGNNSTTNALVPTPVMFSAVPDFGIPLATAAGSSHRIALGSNGSLAAWGNNYSSQVDGITAWGDTRAPIAVGRPGALENRRVIAVAAGSSHSISLDDEGVVHAWGSNQSGQLGTSADSYGKGPVPVNTSGVLNNRRVHHIAAGGLHSLALCDDGSIVSWGGGAFGQLGSGVAGSSVVPLRVKRDGALAGRTVVSLAAGAGHSLALCDDGTVVAWGNNANGQLGRGNTQNSASPVALTGGALDGRKVIAIAAGHSHSLALCEDGVLVGWGQNNYGQLGANPDPVVVPAIITPVGALAGHNIISITAFDTASYAMLANRSIAAWGRNHDGRLGNNSTTDSSVPVLVHENAFLTGEKFGRMLDGPMALTGHPPVELTPSPVDGVSLVGTDHTLSWSEEPLALKYHVFFGTDHAAVSAADITSAEYLGTSGTPAWSGPVPELELDGEYFWRVDTGFDRGERRGRVWSFRIAPILLATSLEQVFVPGMDQDIIEVPISTTLPLAQSWSVTAHPPTTWLTLLAANGSTPDPLRLRFDPSGLETGLHQTILRVTSGAAVIEIPLTLRLVELKVTHLRAHPSRPVVYGLSRPGGGESGNRLLEIDAATAKVLRTLPAGHTPVSFSLDPASERIFILDRAGPAGVISQVIDALAWTHLPPLVLNNDAMILGASSDDRLVVEGGNQWGGAWLHDSQSGELLDSRGGVRVGGIVADANRPVYYHSDANSSGARIIKYDISGDVFESMASSAVIAYGGGNLQLSGDGSRIFWQQFAFDTDDLRALARMGGEVYATNRAGSIAVGASAIWYADSGIQAATLPFTSNVATISDDAAHLIRFHEATRTLVSTPLAGLVDLPGPSPRPGQVLDASPDVLSWSPVAGATGYRVFLASSEAALMAMTAPTATVDEPRYELPSALMPGMRYLWRVDAIVPSGIITGSVRGFDLRFTEPVGVARVSTGSGSTSGRGVSITDGRLLLGTPSAAWVMDFDSAVGPTGPPRQLTPPSGGDSRLVLDGPDKVIFGGSGHGIVDTRYPEGAVEFHRLMDGNYWSKSDMLTLPWPLPSEAFGTGVAASGNLFLAGTGNSSSNIGRVAAGISEPEVVHTQTFSAGDGYAGDGFGFRIVMHGNHAVIAAPGGNQYSSQIGRIYAFTRSTSDGLWRQSQRINLSGAIAGSKPGTGLAMHNGLMAASNGSGGVVVHSRNASGDWVAETVIHRGQAAGSSSTFGSHLAILDDLLFIGDTDATYQGFANGAVFVFRQDGGNWLQMPVITPQPISVNSPGYREFGGSLAAYNGWLAACGGRDKELWLFRVAPHNERQLRFLPGIPTTLVTGRPISIPISFESPEFAVPPVVEMLQGPKWLEMTGDGDTGYTLTAPPRSEAGLAVDVQLRVMAGGHEAYHAMRLTMISQDDLPVPAELPDALDLTVGDELVIEGSATGTGPFGWQWFRDGEAVPGANGPMLAVDEADSSATGIYHLRVTNPAGAVDSGEVVVTIRPADATGLDWTTVGASPAHRSRQPVVLDSRFLVPAWTHEVVADRASAKQAVIHGDQVVLVSGSSRNAPGAVTAISLESGEQRWISELPAAYSYTSPTYHDGTIYLQRINNSGGNMLLALEADTGKERWSTPFGAQWDTPVAPAVTDTGIFINGGTYGGMYGFELDGKFRFFRTMAQVSNWTPSIHRGRLYSYVSGVFAEHDPATGNITHSKSGLAGTGVPAIAGDTAVVVASNRLYCFDLITRTLRWEAAGPYRGRAALGGGRVHVIHGESVRAHAIHNGDLLATYQCDEELAGQPIITNDRLIVAGATKTTIFDLESTHVIQELALGGHLSYANHHLLIVGEDGIARAFKAVPHGRVALSGPDGEPIEHDGASLRVGAPPVGASSVTAITLVNSGIADLSALAWSFEGVHPTNFSVTNVPETSLAPGASTTLEITHTPSTTGPRDAVLVIASDDPSRPKFRLPVFALPPDVAVSAATDITGVSAALNGWVTANDNEIAIVFDYGITEKFGTTVVAVPATMSGDDEGVASATISGLPPGTSHHFRVGGTNAYGTHWSEPMTFTTLSDNAKLAALGTSAGDPAPVFEKEKFRYFISVAHSTDQISITPITDHPGAKVQIGGQYVVSGTASQELPLTVGNNTLTVFVTAEDRITALTYTLVVTRLPAVLALNESGVPPITADGFFANNLQAMLRLDFHPAPGSKLMVVNNTSLAFIHGRFANLAHGQRVWLSHDGEWYAFVANYYGGTGNDLVLQWAGTRVAAWGLNNYGQLGDGSATQRLRPVAADDSGMLADKTIFALATGYLHSVALTSDGKLASWGYNVQGQLGNNALANSSAPVPVDTYGVLSDKVVVAITSGSYHNLALCSDGTVAAWGFNNHGQLGDGTKTIARTPVLVKMDGVLAGKQVVAIAAGAYQSYALCSDGTIAAWGYNDEGELGNGSKTSSLVPVAVDVSGALAGREVAAISAGQYHALALCTDGTVVSWGYNQRGQLGNSSNADSASPVEINSVGALEGKSVKAIAAGASHSLALSSDGTLATWGFNSQSQLGATGINQSTTPVAVAQANRSLVALAAGANHNLLYSTDGSMTTWGGNSSGQLGSNNTQASATPVDVDTSALQHGGFIMFAASGCASSHNLAVFAVPVGVPAGLLNPSGLEAWRLEHFADIGVDHPRAADHADFDDDGISNLVEYAFGLNPRAHGGGVLPAPNRIGNRLEIRFSRALSAADIEYRAEWSPDLQPGNWHDVPDSGNAAEHIFSMPMDTAPSMFMRLRVSSRSDP